MQIAETSPGRVKKLLNLLMERKGYILSFVLLGLVIAAAVSFFLPKLYRASSRVIFKYDSVQSAALNRSGTLNNEIRNILSEENISFVKNSLMLHKDLKQNLEVKDDIATTSLIVTAVCETPERSAEVANSVVETFLSNALINNRGVYLALINKLAEREKENADQIQRNAANYQEFIANAEIKKLNPRDLLIVDKIADLESELELVEYDNQLNQLKLNKLSSFLEKRFPDVNKNPPVYTDKINTLKTTLARAETERTIKEIVNKIHNVKYSFPWNKSYGKVNSKLLFTTLKNFIVSYITKNHGNLNNVDKRLLENLLWKIEETKLNLNSIDLSKSVLYDIITNLEDKFSLIPVRYFEIAQLERQKKFSLKLSGKLKTKINQYKKEAENYFAEVDSVTKAVVPKSSFSPNIPLNLIIGSLAGLLLGIVLSISKTKNKLEIITSAEDIEELPYQLIAEIPNFPHGIPIVLNPAKIQNNKTGKTILSSFENIETFLKYGNLEGKIKSVLITSQNKEEGKSLIAANLAITVAGSGSKVLLVDMNFVNPKIAKMLNIRPLPSLPHYLLKKAELNEIIKKTDIQNLSIIPAIEVSQNTDSLMNGQKMKEFMKTITTNYDFVIFDSPSLSALPETAVTTKYVDQTILVTKLNKTKLSDINQAASKLKDYGIDNFGIILNDVES